MVCFLLPGLLCLLSLSPLVETPVPLSVVAVVRQGLPPFEEGERLYRLEGRGSSQLRSGDKVLLQRSGEKSCSGRLKVLEVHDEYALATLDEEGETYPLKGDLAQRIEPPRPLPVLPTQKPEEALPRSSTLAVSKPIRELTPSVPKPVLPAPSAPAWVPSPSSEPVASHSQPIYFLKENASLSPGAVEKLKKITATWGLKDRWVLGYPGNAGLIPSLQQERLGALRGELQRLGVETPELRVMPPEPAGRYDVIYVLSESR